MDFSISSAHATHEKPYGSIVSIDVVDKYYNRYMSKVFTNTKKEYSVKYLTLSSILRLTWYDREILVLMIIHKTFNKAALETRIPAKDIKKSFHKSKKEIEDFIKKYS